MKIFSWVHRRFNNKAENTKKNGDVAAEDEQFPGENKCNDVFERWRGGILAIGTFGYHPLKDDENDEHLNGYSSEEGDEYDDDDSSEQDQLDDDEDEEHNPLVLSTTHSFNAETEMVENWSHEDDELQFGFEYVMMKKQERTTLADLFSADSQHQDNTTDTDTNTNTKKQTLNKNPDLLKEKANRKQGLISFGNKLIAKDARPIHKLNQLMRRMLKRKIHPDVGPTNSKVAAMNSNNSINKCRTTTDDYASLLPTQDGNM